MTGAFETYHELSCCHGMKRFGLAANDFFMKIESLAITDDGQVGIFTALERSGRVSISFPFTRISKRNLPCLSLKRARERCGINRGGGHLPVNLFSRKCALRLKFKMLVEDRKSLVILALIHRELESGERLCW
jgi:hypothetical protein